MNSCFTLRPITGRIGATVLCVNYADTFRRVCLAVCCLWNVCVWHVTTLLCFALDRNLWTNQANRKRRHRTAWHLCRRQFVTSCRHRTARKSRTRPMTVMLHLLHSAHHLHSVCFNILYAPCGLRGWKNRPTPFPGRMSYRATKPGSVCPLS